MKSCVILLLISVFRLENYVCENYEGENEWCQYYRAKHKLTSQDVRCLLQVFIKIHHKSELDENGIWLLKNQVAFLEKLNHSKIMKLLDVLEVREKIILIFEYIQGYPLS